MLDIIDNGYIENINHAMVMIFDTEYNLFNKSLVIEDGCITQVVYPDRTIKGVSKMLLVPVDFEQVTSGTRKRHTKVLKLMERLVEDFMSSNNECCEVVDETHMFTHYDSIRITLNKVVKDKNCPCTVFRVDGRIYLKKGQREDNQSGND